MEAGRIGALVTDQPSFQTRQEMTLSCRTCDTGCWFSRCRWHAILRLHFEEENQHNDESGSRSQNPALGLALTLVISTLALSVAASSMPQGVDRNTGVAGPDDSEKDASASTLDTGAGEVPPTAERVRDAWMRRQRSFSSFSCECSVEDRFVQYRTPADPFAGPTKAKMNC